MPKIFKNPLFLVLFLIALFAFIFIIFQMNGEASSSQICHEQDVPAQECNYFPY